MHVIIIMMIIIKALWKKATWTTAVLRFNLCFAVCRCRMPRNTIFKVLFIYFLIFTSHTGPKIRAPRSGRKSQKSELRNRFGRRILCDFALVGGDRPRWGGEIVTLFSNKLRSFNGKSEKYGSWNARPYVLSIAACDCRLISIWKTICLLALHNQNETTRTTMERRMWRKSIFICDDNHPNWMHTPTKVQKNWSKGTEIPSKSESTDRRRFKFSNKTKVFLCSRRWHAICSMRFDLLLALLMHLPIHYDYVVALFSFFLCQFEQTEIEFKSICATKHKK